MIRRDGHRHRPVPGRISALLAAIEEYWRANRRHKATWIGGILGGVRVIGKSYPYPPVAPAKAWATDIVRRVRDVNIRIATRRHAPLGDVRDELIFLLAGLQKTGVVRGSTVVVVCRRRRRSWRRRLNENTIDRSGKRPTAGGRRCGDHRLGRSLTCIQTKRHHENRDHQRKSDHRSRRDPRCAPGRRRGSCDAFERAAHLRRAFGREDSHPTLAQYFLSRTRRKPAPWLGGLRRQAGARSARQRT